MVQPPGLPWSQRECFWRRGWHSIGIARDYPGHAMRVRVQVSAPRLAASDRHCRQRSRERRNRDPQLTSSRPGRSTARSLVCVFPERSEGQDGDAIGGHEHRRWPIRAGTEIVRPLRPRGKCRLDRRGRLICGHSLRGSSSRNQPCRVLSRPGPTSCPRQRPPC